jgi:predicted enzyme related to lactoylglutathione lyase
MDTAMATFQGITWHAIVVDADEFDAQKNFIINSYGVSPAMEMDNVSVFYFPNGDVFELYTPETVMPWGLNDGVAFGFRVDDVAEAAQQLEAAGAELLGEIARFPEYDYAWQHFRGIDGKVYGINENKPQPSA